MSSFVGVAMAAHVRGPLLVLARQVDLHVDYAHAFVEWNLEFEFFQADQGEWVNVQ